MYFEIWVNTNDFFWMNHLPGIFPRQGSLSKGIQFTNAPQRIPSDMIALLYAHVHPPQPAAGRDVPRSGS